jgi:UDP-N-acetyl-D-glucosamine/UDP-N-acetyl-D-galactosamine dehydrogenase
VENPGVTDNYEDAIVTERFGIIGLGYVGLPVALAFARKFPGTVGFDIDAAKVSELARGFDRNGEHSEAELTGAGMVFTSKRVTFFVVAVPTPVDSNNVPDLTPVVRASESVAKVLERGAVVVYESTVYPGVTEDICGPLLAKASGLPRDAFYLGYSPERINPGDREHTLERIVKVVSGEDAQTLERVSKAYGAIIDAGVHAAPSIKVAEAAKVIENTQRDINIALMNELAFIFERMGIRTTDVLAAAGTKWNFLPFKPGLVGGHCIGVDPYYLTTKAQQLGYQPEVILAGRRINNHVGTFIAQKTVKMLIEQDRPVKGARVGVLGVTFKEDVTDTRNSRVPDILKELSSFGIQALVADPSANPKEVEHEYGLTLSPLADLRDLDALIIAVAHKEYRTNFDFFARLRAGAGIAGGVVVDVKGLLSPAAVPDGIAYWSL